MTIENAFNENQYQSKKFLLFLDFREAVKSTPKEVSGFLFLNILRTQVSHDYHRKKDNFTSVKNKRKVHHSTNI